MIPCPAAPFCPPKGGVGELWVPLEDTKGSKAGCQVAQSATKSDEDPKNLPKRVLASKHHYLLCFSEVIAPTGHTVMV